MVSYSSNALPYSIINSSTYEVIASLHELMLSLCNIDNTIHKHYDYEFLHSPPTIDEINVYISNSNSSLYQCNGCLYDCSMFVIDEANCYTKSYVQFLSNVLTNSDTTTEIQRDYGWKLNTAYMRYMSMLNYTYNNNNDDNIRLEAGGGSGIGFQLYCDADMIMTTGGGGGGGIEGSFLNNNTHYISYGTGGGAGIQIRIINNTNGVIDDNNWISIGGGGGCGTNGSNYNNTFSNSKLQCGIKLDDNNTNDYSKYIESFKTKLRTCNSIRGDYNNYHYNYHYQYDYHEIKWKVVAVVEQEPLSAVVPT